MDYFTEVPLLSYGFSILTLGAVTAFYLITGGSRTILVSLILWGLLHGGLAHYGFYATTDTLPPRLALAMAPMLLVAILIGFTGIGKGLREVSNLEWLHYFQGIRIPVEAVFLKGLFAAGCVAEALTFHGNNYDIIPGLLGPVVGFLVFRRKLLPRSVSIIYNLGGIFILGWTFVQAVLSAPSPYQQYGLEQPTVAIFYLPFVWLPALVAPLMIWAHCVVLGKEILSEG